MSRSFFFGGTLQVSITVFVGFIVAWSIGRPFGESVFLGCLLSLSSTAIVLKLLAASGNQNTPHGRNTLSILIYQDMVTVPMMLVIPLLAGVSYFWEPSVIFSIGKGLVILAVAVFLAEMAVPFLFHYIARARSREIFLLAILFICLSVTYLSEEAGLSLSLGAFLAGLILSDSEYRHQAIGDIIPLQDIFTSLFFISLGMLVDLSYLAENVGLILSVALLVILMKTSVATFAGLVIGLPLRTTVLMALALGQVGEFSFVLAKTGINFHIGSEDLYQLFLSVALLTMLLTPLLMHAAPFVADWIVRLPLPAKIKGGLTRHKPHEGLSSKQNHTVIIGYGMSGKYLAKACREGKIDHVILEINADIVHAEKKKNIPIFYGDATHTSILEQVGIAHAKAVAIIIDDVHAVKTIVTCVRHLNPNVYIITRVNHLNEIPHLIQLGSTEVIADEFETSLEIFTRVLEQYSLSTEDMEKLVLQVRSEGHEKYRYKPHSHLG